MLETGAVRRKNRSNILLKNLLDTCVGAITFFMVGFGLANEAGGGLVGTKYFFGAGLDEKLYLDWVFQYVFCSTATTIVSGSLAERTFLDTYILYSLIMTSVIFPVASAWAWGGGWLQKWGFHDFAGSAVVHMLGGVGGFLGTLILKPRLGIFRSAKVVARETLATMKT